MADFEKAFDFLMGNEGGLAHNKYDRGGATKFGITKRTYSSFIGREATDGEIYCMAVSQAKACYKKMYWDAMHLDLIENDAVAAAIFDQGVNRGPQTVIKEVQSIIGQNPDGIIGPVTAKVINQENPEQLIKNMANSAIYAYKRICDKDNSQLVFLSGWINRANKLLELTV